MSVYGSSIRSTTGAHTLLAPSGPAPSRKRKVSDDEEARTNISLHSSSSSSLVGIPHPPHLRQPAPWQRPQAIIPAHPTTPAAPKRPASAHGGPTKPGGNRLLMAGYLAHEFLSHGKLFGRPYGTSTINTAAPSTEELRQKEQQQYDQVTKIMFGPQGVHVPGVVNPTQLGRWLEKQ